MIGKIAIMPMGFCYPGKIDKGGDKPPRPECAPAWHDKVLKYLKAVELTLLVGSYAQNYYLKATKKENHDSYYSELERLRSRRFHAATPPKLASH